MRRAPAFLSLALGLLVAVAAFDRPALAEPAGAERAVVLAQADRQDRSIFRYLFRREGQQPRLVPAPQPPRQQARPQRQRQEARPRRQRERARARAEQRAPAPPSTAAPAAAAVAAAVPGEAQTAERTGPAKRIMVLGDFLATQLAKGLAEAYVENPNVVVVDATSGDSGLVRDDHYNWPAELPALVEAQKPDALVVMIGANDRQPIGAPNGSQSLGTEGWRAEYSSRVAEFADALKATGKPVFWGSLVPVSSAQMSRDYSTFNSIMREQLDAKAVPFVDFWNGFADESGGYAASGPDISGQTVQLRTSGGINFTRSGQRKLAFFMEQPLDDVVGGEEEPIPVALPLPATPQIASPESDVKSPPLLAPEPGAPPQPPAPRIGPMVDLETLHTPDTETLSTAAAEADRGAASVVVLRRLGREGGGPPRGRADNFSWTERLTP